VGRARASDRRTRAKTKTTKGRATAEIGDLACPPGCISSRPCRTTRHLSGPGDTFSARTAARGIKSFSHIVRALSTQRG
jgi:hypothetical protein